MAEANYTLKLTLSEAVTIKNLLRERKKVTDKAATEMISQGHEIDKITQEELRVLDKLLQRL